MPILEKESDIFPPDLLDEAPACLETGRCWWAVYTKARQEKALARQLLQQGVAFYLPLVPRDNLIRNRKVRSYTPLFNGYVFVFGNETDRVATLATNRTSRLLPVLDQQQLRSDLSQIRRLIASDAPLTVERRLTPGQAVRIKTGPLAGLEGTVISRRAQTRLLVTVSMLQQGVSVEIDDFLLEPC